MTEPRECEFCDAGTDVSYPCGDPSCCQQFDKCPECDGTGWADRVYRGPTGESWRWFDEPFT